MQLLVCCEVISRNAAILTNSSVIVAVTYLILYYSPTLPDVTPRYILGKVYSNTMMVNLNHRMKFSGGRDDDDTTRVENIDNDMPALTIPSTTEYSVSNTEGYEER